MIKVFGILINEKIIYIIVSLVVGYLVYKMLLSVVKKSLSIRMKRAKVDKRKLRTLNVLLDNIIKYTFVVAILMIILSILGVNTGAIIASIGVVGLAIGLAIQDTLRDILAGAFILMENQYAIGDIIMVGNFKGEVIFLGLKSTKIRSETGEVKILSNRNITDIINYSLSRSTLFIDIALDYDNDESLVDAMLNKLATKLAKDIENIIDCKYLGIHKLDNKVTYRLSVDADIRHHDVIERQVLREIKKALDISKVRR